MRIAVHLPAEHPVRRHSSFAALLERGAVLEWPGHTWSESGGLAGAKVHGFLVAVAGAGEAARLATRLQGQREPWVLLIGDHHDPGIWCGPGQPAADDVDAALRALIQGALERALEPAVDAADEAWLRGDSPAARRLRSDFEACASQAPGDMVFVGSTRAGAAALARALHRRWTRGERLLEASDVQDAALGRAADRWIEVGADAEPIPTCAGGSGLRLWQVPSDPDAHPGLRDLRRLELPTLSERLHDLPAIGEALLERAPGPGPRAYEDPALSPEEWHALARTGPLELVLTLLRQGAADRPRLARPAPAGPAVEAPAAALPAERSADSGTANLTLELEDRRLETLERRLIERVLDECAGNKSQAAGLLGLHRQTLYNKIERHGL